MINEFNKTAVIHLTNLMSIMNYSFFMPDVL